MTELPLSESEEAFIGLLSLMASPKASAPLLKTIEAARDKAVVEVTKAEKAVAARIRKLEAEASAIEASTAEVIAGVNAAEAALADKEKAFVDRMTKIQKSIDESQAESLRIKDEASKASRKASRDTNAAAKLKAEAEKQAEKVAATLERMEKAGIKVAK